MTYFNPISKTKQRGTTKRISYDNMENTTISWNILERYHSILSLGSATSISPSYVDAMYLLEKNVHFYEDRVFTCRIFTQFSCIEVGIQVLSV